MFGLSARSFGQETVFVSSLYSKEWMCNVSPFHTRYDTHTMLKGLSGSSRPLGVIINIDSPHSAHMFRIALITTSLRTRRKGLGAEAGRSGHKLRPSAAPDSRMIS